MEREITHGNRGDCLASRGKVGIGSRHDITSRVNGFVFDLVQLTNPYQDPRGIVLELTIDTDLRPRGIIAG